MQKQVPSPHAPRAELGVAQRAAAEVRALGTQARLRLRCARQDERAQRRCVARAYGARQDNHSRRAEERYCLVDIAAVEARGRDAHRERVDSARQPIEWKARALRNEHHARRAHGRSCELRQQGVKK